VWEDGGGWVGLLERPLVEVRAPSRDDCVERLADAAGDGAALVVEVLPALAGVAEAAVELLGRRVVRLLRELLEHPQALPRRPDAGAEEPLPELGGPALTRCRHGA
jgi:hypothetical protein